jgi:hypothetical protein
MVDGLPAASASQHLAAMGIASEQSTPRQRGGCLERNRDKSAKSNHCRHLKLCTTSTADHPVAVALNQLSLGSQYQSEGTANRDDSQWFKACIEQKNGHRTPSP